MTNATTPIDTSKPGFRAGETWCRCGSRCELVTHEGEDSELCPKCDELLIKAIETGDIPQVQVLDDDGEPFDDGVLFDSEDEPEPEPTELAEQQRREQSEQREYHARLLYQQMVAAVLHVDIESGPRGRPILPPRQVDFEHLAALAFAATDDFDVVAKRERGEE